MSGSATRSRWLELRDSRKAAREGRELLDQKRELLLREVLRWTALRDKARDRAAAALTMARSALAEAQTELGREAVESAALAQPAAASVDIRERSLIGITLPAISWQALPLRIGYAPGGTSESLDRACAAFTALLPLVVGLAQEDLALRNLQKGLAKTNRRLNALEKVILPRLDREIRQVASALEEEERDEAFRRKRRLAGR